ncbi:MAG: sugar transferase [Thermoguttaceae bacterium]
MIHVSKYYSIKWYVDFMVMIITLPVIGSTILFFMLLVRLTSKGPILYTQNRSGKDGKEFKMYKIRSMVIDAEAQSGAVWAGKSDPRITWVGRIMRRVHIDELPQIYNVWKGEMTVIGPRPERPEIVEKLKIEIPGYEQRLQVPPGMTGYAQLNLPADNDLDDVRRKLALDFEYIETVTFWFDMRILAGTAFQFIRFRYFDKLPRILCGIYRNPNTSPWAEQVGLHRKNSDKE